DFHVTGVQTCALPICVDVDPAQVILTCGASPALLLAMLSRFEAGDRIAFARPGYIAYRNTAIAARLQPLEIGCGPESRYQLTARSEERRVGKEGRSRR